MFDALRDWIEDKRAGHRDDDPALRAIHRRTRRGDEPVGQCFVSKDGRAIVPTLLRTREGIVVEADECTVVAPGDELALGVAMRAAMAAHGRVVDRDVRGTKLTDWPAFRASGARSVAAFTEGATRVIVRARAHGAAIIEARPCRATDEGSRSLSAWSRWNARPESLGADIAGVVRFVAPCAETGFFAG